MSLFWTYFRDKLRFPLIWKPGPLAVLVKGAALVLDDVRDSILWLRAQFSPETCDDDHVFHFAKSRGIRRHRLETDDARFKNRVIRAYAWQMLGGGNLGLPEILKHYGYRCNKIVNVRDADPDRWAEFKAEVQPEAGKGFTAEDFDLIPYVINDQKPARSLLSEVVLHVDTQSASPKAGPSMMFGESITVYPWSQTEAELSCEVPYIGIGYQSAETIIVYPGGA